MTFRLVLTNSAHEDIQWFRTREQKLIIKALKTYLVDDADVESNRRKRLRPNELAPWELRLGDLRVFYVVKGNTVRVIAVGYKEHNALFIRRTRVEL